MSQNDFSPQHDYSVGVIPDECGESATNYFISWALGLSGEAYINAAAR
jgi:hypothetical protein